MIHPQGPRLDSWRITNNGAVLIYSISRILQQMHMGESDMSGGYFVARVPVRVEILFDSQLIELSYPQFADVKGGPFPQRSFALIGQIFHLLRRDVLPPEWRMVRLDGRNFFRHLESSGGAEDLGWEIERPDGSKFDTTQKGNHRGLKEIFVDFQGELAKKCRESNLANPLEGLDLYAIFRTIKSESHTATMMLKAPLGSRGGSIIVEGFFGGAEDGGDPVFRARADGFSKIAHMGFRQRLVEAKGLQFPNLLSSLLATSHARQ